MNTITSLAQELDVSPRDVQDYVARLVEQDGETAVIAHKPTQPEQAVLTEAAAQRVRVQLTH